MTNTRPKIDPDDFVGTAGGGDVPAAMRRSFPPIAQGGQLNSLDRHIMQMFSLHPEIALEFRGKGDLSKMDELTKRMLLSDIYTVLKIDPTIGSPCVE